MQIIKMAEEVVAKNTVKNGTYNDEICIITLVDLDGYPSSSVITPAKADGIRTIWFGINADSSKMKHLKKNTKACVCFGSGEYNISLTGEAEAISDLKVKQEIWYNGLEHHFAGFDDPTYYALKFTTKRYDLLFPEAGYIRGEIEKSYEN